MGTSAEDRVGGLLSRRRALTLLASTPFFLSKPAQPAFASEGADEVAALPSTTWFCAAVPGLPGDLTELNNLAAKVGKKPRIASWYTAWTLNSDFPASQANQVALNGSLPEVVWEPWDPAEGTFQPAYTLDRITSGAFDPYIRKWAQQIRTYARTVLIRFAHEMNGNWYPWSEQVNNNGPGDYIAAWRHVHGIFTAERATNVQWRWSPNVPYPGSTPLPALYPGDSYVTHVALDGYNWSTLLPGGSWQSFWQIFQSGITTVRGLTSKPLYIGETACTETDGDKAAWITDMFATLNQHLEIRGFTWFNYNKETDWRIESSQASLNAFKAGLTT
ncbi:glycoside hydrolase family 26 protein [Flindersiella endophytica]